MIREIEEFDALLIKEPVKIQIGYFAKLARAHVAFAIDPVRKFSLKITKCRFLSIEESPFYTHLRDQFPSVSIEVRFVETAYNEYSHPIQYIVFNDDMDAVHFKLKYC